MTQDESFPGRPRGRRARRDDPGSEWPGHEAAPDQREFPDLAPVRPRGARERDAQVQGQPGQPPARPAPRDGYGAYPAGRAPAGGGWPGSQYAGSGYPGDGYGAPAPPGQPRGGQPPWPQQPGPGYQGQQQAPPRPPEQPQEQRQQADETPSWAEPDSVEAFSERWRRRGLESRDEQRTGRKKRRRLLTAAGTAAALAVAVAVYLLNGGPGAANLGFGNFVTSFLPGELQQVPNPCTSLSPATLSQYMPGKTRQAAPPLNSGASTECTWTLDSPPTYRVLQVQLQAYSPSGLASGNGSATFAAEDAYQSFENGFAKPGPSSGQPKADVTDLTGMPGGSQTSAFQATEVFNRGGAVMDVANVLVRYRNVIITVVVDGLNQDSGGKTYATSMSGLTAAANAVGREMAAQIAK